MKIKVADLRVEDGTLDLAVAICEGATDFRYDGVATYWVTLHGKDRALAKGWAQSFTPSTDPAQAYEIVLREGIATIQPAGIPGQWWASKYQPNDETGEISVTGQGTTPLDAAMRCHVASKLGNEIELSEEITMIRLRYKQTEPHQHDWQYTTRSGSWLQCVLCGKYEWEK